MRTAKINNLDFTIDKIYCDKGNFPLNDWCTCK